MPILDAPAVAKLLVEIGQRLALAGENPYKARSYSRAAQSLMALTMPLDVVVASGRLQELPGVGAALSKTIEELHRSGTTASLERMRAEFPASALELARIPALPPKKAVDLHAQQLTQAATLNVSGLFGRLDLALVGRAHNMQALLCDDRPLSPASERPLHGC